MPMHRFTRHRVGTCVEVAMCCRSLLSNLRLLSLDKVAFPLPALQPIATRLQSLEVLDSFLEGSADGFLTAAWTALTALRLDDSEVVDDVLTALNLPALEALRIMDFEHQGGVLQPDQLCCPQLCSLAFQLDSSLAAPEVSRQCQSLLSLPRLTALSSTLMASPTRQPGTWACLPPSRA